MSVSNTTMSGNVMTFGLFTKYPRAFFTFSASLVPATFLPYVLADEPTPSHRSGPKCKILLRMIFWLLAAMPTRLLLFPPTKPPRSKPPSYIQTKRYSTSIFGASCTPWTSPIDMVWTRIPYPRAIFAQFILVHSLGRTPPPE